MNKMNKEERCFKKFKKLITDFNDTKEKIDMFYFNSKAIEYANKIVDKHFMMNEYFSLTAIDLLLMTEESENLVDVYDDLMKEFEYEYAESMYENYIYCITREVK